jgi:predicted nucleic acid-binding protein
MTKKTVIDTDILIDVSRGIQEAIDVLSEIESNSVGFISTITEMELLVGCRNKKEQTQVKKFLKRFERFSINELISDKALELLLNYRLSHGLLIPDALIASTAIVNNISLISKNQSDFRFIEGLDLLSYPLR